jgi:hypothetical protein
MTASLPRERGLGGFIAILGLLGCLWLGLQSPRQALLAYLSAYLFFLAPVLGSTTLLMVHALTGGRWGSDLRPGLLAISRLLPLFALLLIPVLVSATRLYPWADLHAASAPSLSSQRWYLNLPFFWLRAIGCMALWLGLARGLRRRLLDRDLHGPPVAFASFGLIAYALTITVAAVDWVGSLVPQWHSSTFGLTIGTGQLLSAAALAVLLLHRRGSVTLAPSRLRDLGILLMTLMLAWAYLVLMDFLTAWIADLRPEIAWYLPRLATGWRWLGALLVVLNLVVPFAVLLSRHAKERPLWLKSVASLLLLGQMLFALWIVLPGVWMPSLVLVSTLPLAILGIGALCWVLLDFKRPMTPSLPAQRSAPTHRAESAP